MNAQDIARENAAQAAIKRIRDPAQRVYAREFWTWLARRPVASEFVDVPADVAARVERKIERATGVYACTRKPRRARRKEENGGSPQP